MADSWDFFRSAIRFGPYVLDPTQGLRRGRTEVRLTNLAIVR